MPAVRHVTARARWARDGERGFQPRQRRQHLPGAGLLDQRSQVPPQVGRALTTGSARQQHAALRVEIGEGQRLARGVIEQGLRVALCQVGIAELERALDAEVIEMQIRMAGSSPRPAAARSRRVLKRVWCRRA